MQWESKKPFDNAVLHILESSFTFHPIRKHNGEHVRTEVMGRLSVIIPRTADRQRWTFSRHLLWSLKSTNPTWPHLMGLVPSRVWQTNRNLSDRRCGFMMPNLDYFDWFSTFKINLVNYGWHIEAPWLMWRLYIYEIWYAPILTWCDGSRH